MPDIIDPQVRRFSNEEARVVADRATEYYYKAVAFLDEWDATGMGALIPDTVDRIIDRDQDDGRTWITGAIVHGLHDHLAVMVADMEANNNAKLNVLLQIEVNGSP